MARPLSLVLPLSLLLACTSASAPPPADAGAARFEVENPSGSCVAPNDGSRAGYHSSAGLPWVLDCQNPLAREYWRVFAVDPEHAAMIPRPDGSGYLQAACTDSTQALHAITQTYGLCKSASNSAEVERVNSMAIGDALLVAREQHRQLRFTHVRDDIQPFPVPSDIVDACNLHDNATLPELQAMCERERGRLESGNDIGFSYGGPGGLELAKRLNELYGIPASEDLACVTYPDGAGGAACDAAASCGVWSMQRVVCGAPCESTEKKRSYCVRGGSADVVCRAEVPTGDLYADRGGGDPDDWSNWRECTEVEKTQFDQAEQNPAP